MKKLTLISLVLAVFILNSAFTPSRLSKKITPLKSQEIQLDYFQFIKYLSDGNPDSLEGIYATKNKRYVVALIKNETKSHDFIGVVVSSENPDWNSGEIKFNLVRNSAKKLEGFFYDTNGKKHQVSLKIGNSTLGNNLLNKVALIDLQLEQLVDLGE